MQKTQFCREQLAQPFSGHLARTLESRLVKITCVLAGICVLRITATKWRVLSCLLNLISAKRHHAVSPVSEHKTVMWWINAVGMWYLTCICICCKLSWFLVTMWVSVLCLAKACRLLLLFVLISCTPFNAVLFQVRASMTQMDKYTIALRPCVPVTLLFMNQLFIWGLTVANESASCVAMLDKALHFLTAFQFTEDFFPFFDLVMAFRKCRVSMHQASSHMAFVLWFLCLSVLYMFHWSLIFVHLFCPPVCFDVFHPFSYVSTCFVNSACSDLLCISVCLVHCLSELLGCFCLLISLCSAYYVQSSTHSFICLLG